MKDKRVNKENAYIDDHVDDLGMDHPDVGVKQGYLIIYIIAFVLLVTTFALWLAALIDQRWAVYTINSTTLVPTNDNIVYYNRFRGLWLVCLDRVINYYEKAFVSKNLLDIVFEKCLSIQQQNVNNIDARKTATIASMRLLTQVVAIVTVGLICLTVILQFLLSLYWCIKRTVCPKLFRKYLVLILFVHFISICMQVVLLIVYHEMHRSEKFFIEKSFIDVLSNWPSAVRTATITQIGIAYMLAWISLLFSVVSFLFFFFLSSAVFNWLYCPCCMSSACCYTSTLLCHTCLFFCCKKCGIFHNHTVKCHLTTRRYDVLNLKKGQPLKHIYQHDESIRSGIAYFNWVPGWHKGQNRNFVDDPREVSYISQAPMTNVTRVVEDNEFIRRPSNVTIVEERPRSTIRIERDFERRAPSPEFQERIIVPKKKSITE